MDYDTKMIETVMEIERDGVPCEVRIQGDYVPAEPGGRDDPSYPAHFEDVRAFGLEDDIPVDLTVAEEHAAEATLLAALLNDLED